MISRSDLIVPDWPAPANVRAFFTTRGGGTSRGGFASLNLGLHVGDEYGQVQENRARFLAMLPSAPRWLNQVHGTNVLEIGAESAPSADVVPQADAVMSRESGKTCVVLVADCLPVLFCNDAGSCVAAAHAGWRGLAAGVLERTVESMKSPTTGAMAWLGPAIGASAFEVGQDVVDAFVSQSIQARRAFTPIDGKPGKYLADIFQLARQRLSAVGIERIYGGQFCTVSDPARFFSYRRDGRTGRMAGVIWRE